MCFGGGGGGDSKKMAPAPVAPTYNNDPTAAANRQRFAGMTNAESSGTFGSTLGSASSTPASMPTMTASR